MKLFTNEGFSFALQVTSLILLVGYSASNTTNNLPEVSHPKMMEVYPPDPKIKNEYKLDTSPYLNTEIPKNTTEAATPAGHSC